MRKFSIYTLVFVAILLTISCRKDRPLFDGVSCSGNCYTLTGKLVDSAVNSGIARGEIKFYFYNHRGYSNKKIYLGRTVTDGNGNYTFRFDGRFTNVRGYYTVEAYKDNLFHDPFYGNRVSTFDLDSSLYNIPIIQNFALFRPSTVNLRIVANTVSSSESVIASYSYGVMRHGILLNGRGPVDTTVSFKTAGDIRTFISVAIMSAGFSNSRNDTIIVKANAIRKHEIRF